MGHAQLRRAAASAILAALVSTTTIHAQADDSNNNSVAGADPTCSQTSVPHPTRQAAFDQFLRPLVENATARRSAEQHDPTNSERIDTALNARRLNVALMGYGEEHGQPYAAQGVSITILSIDLDTWQVASLSFSRDIRVPELEDRRQGPGRQFEVLRNAYHLLGFEKMRALLEEMSGLSIDYQIVMKDVLLQNYLQAVGGPIVVDVPTPLDTQPYQIGGVAHGPDHLAPGVQVLDPDHAITFIMGENADPIGKDDERSNRKNLLIQAITCQIKQQVAQKNAGFLLNLARFSAGELGSKDLESDFDFGTMTQGVGRMAQAFVLSGGNVDTSFPSTNPAQMLVISDASYGDGGLRRVHKIIDSPDSDGPDNPLVKQETALGVLPGYLQIPIGGNPFAPDLVTDYWGSVRAMIRTALTSEAGRASAN